MKVSSEKTTAPEPTQLKSRMNAERKNVVLSSDGRIKGKALAGPADSQKSPAAAFNLSLRVRSLRKQHNITLEELAKRSGLVRSTLSKVENGRMSPTFEVLLKLASGFGMDLAELLKPQVTSAPTGRFAVTEAEHAEQIEYPNYVLIPHAGNLKTKQMLPFVSRMTAKSLEDFKDWNRHETEDFMIVTRGQMTFYSETYEPVVLNPGDSIYFDGRMGHACVSSGDDLCEAIYVCTQH